MSTARLILMAVLLAQDSAKLSGHNHAWSPDGKRLATGSRDMTVRVWTFE